MSRTYANLIDEENLAEYTWLGVTYSGYSGTLIIYVNGEVLFTISSLTSVSIHLR